MEIPQNKSNKSNEELFYEALLNLDVNEIEILLQESVDINHIYTKYKTKSREFNAIQIVLSVIIDKKEEEEQWDEYKHKAMQCIKTLLNSGINVTYKDIDYNAQAIGFAVLTGEKEIVELILRKYDQLNISICNIDLISSILNFHQHETQVEEDYLKVIDFLLSKNIDINILDYDTNEPPIYLAAKLKFKEVINLLLLKKFNEIDLDYYADNKGKTARNLILKYDLYENILPEKNTYKYSILYKCLKDQNASNFIENYRGLEIDMSEDKKCSFLLRAVQLGAEEVTEYMIKETANNFKDYKTLLQISCRKGFYKVTELLLEQTNDYDINLVRDLVQLDKVTHNKNKLVDYNACLEVILESKVMDLNAHDRFNKTVLQYAIKMKHYKMVSILLNKGASLVIQEKGK